MLYLLIILIMGASMLVQYRLKSKFRKYGKTRLSTELTGYEVARKMLDEHGLRDVEVISVRGRLTDHYNPLDRTVNLSEAVYQERNAAAAAVAAHECGHAVQHAKSYTWLMFRSRLVPVVSIASRWMPWVILLGIILIQSFPLLLQVGIGMFAATTLFSFITLPVEFDASSRALAWMKNSVVNEEEYGMAKDALKWAALTYVVAALGSLATLLYYVSIYMNRR
jgi:hypothetical protein